MDIIIALNLKKILFTFPFQFSFITIKLKFKSMAIQELFNLFDTYLFSISQKPTQKTEILSEKSK